MLSIPYLLLGGLAWLVPVVIANLTMDMNSLLPLKGGGYPVGFWFNHLLLIGVLAVESLLIFYGLRMGWFGDWFSDGLVVGDPLPWSLPTSFLLANVLLDAIFLIGYFKFPVTLWASVGLSGFLVIFYGGVWLVNKLF